MLAAGVETYQAPSPGQVNVAVDPNSKRLQLLQPFAAWDGKDIEVGLGSIVFHWLLCILIKLAVGDVLPYLSSRGRLHGNLCHAVCCARSRMEHDVHCTQFCLLT